MLLLELHSGHQSWRSSSGLSLTPALSLLLQRIRMFHSMLTLSLSGWERHLCCLFPARKSARCSYTCATRRSTSTWASSPLAEFSFMDRRAAGRRCLHTPLLGWGLLTLGCFCYFCQYFFSSINFDQPALSYSQEDWPVFIFFFYLFHAAVHKVIFF